MVLEIMCISQVCIYKYSHIAMEDKFCTYPYNKVLPLALFDHENV